MRVKTKTWTAYCTAVLFFVIGVVCYGAYSKPVPYEPVRVMFDSTAGRVLFDHKAHYSEGGYGIECGVCHHMDEDDPQACGECHNEYEYVGRADAFHGQCKGCHDDEGAGPVQCSGCHVL